MYQDSANGVEAYGPPTINPPSTHYAGVVSPLTSNAARDFTYSDPRNAPIVNRVERKDGIENHYVYGGESQPVPQRYDSPYSSKFQQTLIRLWPWSINRKWYIAYPAASVMNGGLRNQGLSERTPQLQTRTVGGPGTAQMLPRPAFRRVQNVPRYSTAPQMYQTTSAGG